MTTRPKTNISSTNIRITTILPDSLTDPPPKLPKKICSFFDCGAILSPHLNPQLGGAHAVAAVAGRDDGICGHQGPTAHQGPAHAPGQHDLGAREAIQRCPGYRAEQNKSGG